MALLEPGAGGLSRSPLSTYMKHDTALPEWARRRVPCWCVGALMLGCESKIVIASWSCPPAKSAESTLPVGAGGAAGNAGSPGIAGSVAATGDMPQVPWSTGFENGFCDYEDGNGSCLSTGASEHHVVSDPVKSGSFAAAYTVDATSKSSQMRCIRQGNLPSAAFYGAWYYIPTRATVPTQDGLWNLFHFQGNASAADFHWDISLVNKANGDLRLEVFSYLLGSLSFSPPDQSNNPSIPIGEWFHIEMYLKRAADETGEVRVYQDGALIYQLTNVVTDRSNSPWAQWFVGNLAEKIDPPSSTVYVDEVTLSVTRQP